MSKTPTLDQDDDGFDGEDLTAAEYALGVLDKDERAAAEARSARDAVFADEVLTWVVRLDPLIGEVAPVEPSPALWPRIEAATGRAKTGEALTPPSPANDHPVRGMMLWRVWAVSASVVAAAAIAFIVNRSGLPTVGRPQGPTIFASASGSGPILIATLSLADSKASAFTVAYNPGRSTLYATPAGDFSIPRARAAELWLIPADGKPRPIGVVDPSKPASMPMPPAFKALAKEKATLALSIEPPGGSTTGLPTGPVVAVGQFAAV